MLLAAALAEEPAEQNSAWRLAGVERPYAPTSFSYDLVGASLKRKTAVCASMALPAPPPLSPAALPTTAHDVRSSVRNGSCSGSCANATACSTCARRSTSTAQTFLRKVRKQGYGDQDGDPQRGTAQHAPGQLWCHVEP
jgi:hypothetical protein